MQLLKQLSDLRESTKGVRSLGKANKLYLDNTNLAFALSSDKPEIGNIRETFFFNQMRLNHSVTNSPVSDFLIEGKTFEVGGKNKGQKQLAGAAEGYVVKDDIETGFGNILPLWTFGFNY